LPALHRLRFGAKAHERLLWLKWQISGKINADFDFSVTEKISILSMSEVKSLARRIIRPGKLFFS
jgi:hypothetical protein